MSQLFGEEARQAWLAAGAPDYNAGGANTAPIYEQGQTNDNWQVVQPSQPAPAPVYNAPTAPYPTPAWSASSSPSDPAWRPPNQDVASELAAQYYAAQFGIPIEQARQQFWALQSGSPDEQQYWQNAVGMANAGELNYILGGGGAGGTVGATGATGTTGGTTGTTGTAGTLGTAGTTGTAGTVTTQAPPGVNQDYWNALIKGAQEYWLLQKRQAEHAMALATNADARAAAELQLAQANAALNELVQKQNIASSQQGIVASQAQIDLNRQQLELQKLQAEREYALAQTAEQRAEATLKIQQADLLLRQAESGQNVASSQAQVDIAYQNLALQKQQAEREYALAQTADARAEALLRLQQAQAEMDRLQGMQGMEKTALEMELARSGDTRAQQYYEMQQAESSQRIAAAQQQMGLAQNEDERAAAYLHLQQVQVEANIGKLQLDMQLAVNEDERQAAYLALQQQNAVLEKLKFEASKAQTDRALYADLAKTLLGTASQLRGPRDYAQYQQYLGGGKGVMETLFGSQPLQAFGGMSGQTQPIDLAHMLGQMGMSGAGTTQAPPSISQNAQQQIPLPYQINPAVWDSMGQTGQQMVLSMAEAQGWNADDFLRQIEQARPLGTARPSTVYGYQAPTRT